MKYPGAKWTLAPKIITEFADHWHYVEPFFGSGAVFFSKQPSPHELINDRSGAVVNFFRVLRDRTEELCWSIETTPWARDAYEESLETADDDLEAARRFIVRAWQAHASDFSKVTGWKNRGAVQRGSGMSHRWRKVPEQLRSMAWRLADAEIENRDAIEVIGRFARTDCLIYADPPYPLGVRTQRLYPDEMTDADHVRLLEALVAHPGPAVVSGYRCELYDEALADWRCVTMRAPKTEKGAERVETLWINRRG